MNGKTKLTNPNSLPNDGVKLDEVVVECSQCDFDLTVKLVGNHKERILTPLCIPDYDEVELAATENRDYVNFELEITGNKVGNIILEITSGKDTAIKTVYSKTLEPEYQNVGKHQLKWDGYSNAGILDTKILKDPDLKLKVKTQLCGVKKEKIIKFKNKPAEEKWVDVVISGKQVEVELRVNIKDGGENGVGEFPHPDARLTMQYLRFPKSHPGREKHMRMRDFKGLQNLALSGLETYWSRTIATAKGEYFVTLKPILETENAMDDVKVEYNTNGKWMRSSNPGSVEGIISLFANVLPERAVYNAGWIRYDDGWYYVTPANEDKDFMSTAAHEIGHGILLAYGGEKYSYGHRGSSTVITQKTMTSKHGGEEYSAIVEIDLMKYYLGKEPIDLYERLVASEVDVASLVWLARVQFHD